ncbi:MAG TPA: serine/threonine-protein kinase, partial [Ktedonobacteraceae bacterium]|nr:serine/threonine-protein kinase [Ktedonobacteraceae bacterium]
FEREAQLIASMHHPNIVQIHDFQIASSEEDGTIAYMVMDYVEGQTLADYMHSTSYRGNIPSPAEIVQLFTSICLAVDYAHQQGMIHRDLKPANILLDRRNMVRNPMGEPILTDFGLAKLLGASSTALTAAQLGTPMYIAPEQVNGYAGNERSDIYSLGIILFEMVTGRLPFQGDSPTSVMSQHLTATPPSPRSINPNIPPALEMVIMRCLAKEPSARFPRAASLAAAIAEALNVPVPESLGEPGYPADADYMPTYITPSSLNLPGATPSSPVLPVAQSSTVQPLLAQSGTSLASSSSGGQSTPPVATGNSTGASNPPYAGAMSTPLPSSQSYPTSSGRPTLTSTSNSNPGSAAFAPTQYPPVFNSPPPPVKRRRGLIIGLIALIIILLGGSLGAYLLYLHLGGVTSRSAVLPNSIVGHAFYVSSGQLADGAQGISDQLQIDLQNFQLPPQGKSYYLWLLADKDTTPKPDFLVPPPVHPPILLTNNLPVQQNGSVHYKYQGDAQHNNLLSDTSRLLITLENAGNNPTSPSTDRSTWVYYAELPQELIPGDPTHLRGLDHIRHLYYNEDHLQVKALYGGLDIWVFRNTEKILEWSTTARDDFNGTTANYQNMHDLFTGILDYLDGSPNVHLDVPPGTPVKPDATIAQIGLLEVAANQDPPGDLAHMLLHINQLNRAPDATPQMHILSQVISVAINNATGWLNQVRTDAKRLFYMTPEQLAQPAALNILDDLVTQATYAYIGQLDPNTNAFNPGVLQAHYSVQTLATFDITKNVPESL